MRRLVLPALLLVTTLAPALRADDRPRDVELTQLVVRVERLAQWAARQLGEARRDGDVARVQCLDQRLAEVHALLRQTWYQAERPSPPRGVNAVLVARQEGLRRQLYACVGIHLSESGAVRNRTVVTTEIAPDTPREDPTRMQLGAPEPIPFVPPTL
ncbi:MAG: hypothetical protein KF901_05370 [Myxococcales bacterium]|nr:hypothetical protein [Myxococcales bacterium]